AIGNGGNINISTGSLALTNSAALSTGTFGQGNAGSITINARDSVSLNGGSVDSGVLEGAIGNGGNINISTGSLALTNSASLDSNSNGQGNAGSITINARDMVSLNSGSVGSDVLEGAVGNGGNVDITTGSLALTNGELLSTATNGRGNAGSITINARDRVSLDGVGVRSDGSSPSGVFSGVLEGAVGTGGNINITTGSLTLTNSAVVSTDTTGGGNAGSIAINARDRVTLDGKSMIFSNVLPNAFGTGGTINITTDSLTVRNSAVVLTNTFGGGNAGSITINARDTLTMDGVSSDGSFPSSISSGDVPTDTNTLAQRSAGSQGNINITTGSLKVTNGAQLITNKYGQGSGGDITINARDLVIFDGQVSNYFPSGALSRVIAGAEGKSGNINITTGSLALTHGA
ncbi:MAG: S-layer family protein, partial [Candidatus Eremiobacteraeota bacterium]|nr:S-layer family protein [Candidatus Eremiobacteraeota bacterium]